MRSAAYKNYLLTVLLVVQAFNYMDGLALGLVLQNIKIDLKLSDTQLGFLSGIAFWLFYSVMGIPLARWADRGNRVTIISLTLAIWSVMVALCGTARSFLQLLSIRIGVAVGEAGCIPPAHSLIADYFSRAERPRAVAFYMLGGPLSTVLGYFLSGWLNQLFGWRAMFMMLGLPGVVLVVLTLSTLREPRAPRSAAIREHSREPGLGIVWRTLWSIPSFRHLLMAFAVMSFFVSGISQWQPAFFVRSFGMKTGEIGTCFALVYGVGGLLGTYGCGALASKYAANREWLQLKATAILAGGFGLFSALVYLCTNRYSAFGLMTVAAIGGAAVNGPVFATIQTLVPDRMRATSIAMIYLVANLVGTGLGPLVAGALSDYLRPWAGRESLRYALLLLCPGYLWGMWHLWRAAVTVNRDIESTKTLRDVPDVGTFIVRRAT